MTPPLTDGKRDLFYGRMPNDAAAELDNAPYRLLGILAGMRRGKSREISVTNSQIAKIYGCCPGNISHLLGKIESSGWIRRETPETGRVIVLLFDLKGDKVPVKWTGEEEGGRALTMYPPTKPARAPLHSQVAPPYIASARPDDPSPSEHGGYVAPRSLSEKDQKTSEVPHVPACEEPERISSQRQRPKPARPATPDHPPGSAAVAIGDLLGRLKDQAVPDSPADEPVAPSRPPALPHSPTNREPKHATPKPPPATVEETPSQREFLAGLTPDERARWAKLSDGRRRQILAWFARSVDPLMLGDVRRTLAAVAIEPRAEPPPSIDLPDLIRWMAGKGRPEIAMACASGLIKQLKDQQRSWRYLEGLCQDVTRGTLDPESLATPLEKTLSQIANGRKIPNPAGYWNESVKAWQRDHAGRASF